MLNTLLVQYALPLGAFAFCAAGTAVLVFVAKHFNLSNAKTGWGKALGVVAVSAEAIVNDFEATIVPELKEACADGKLTPVEIARLRNDALARLKATVGPLVLKVLQAGLGGTAGTLDGFLLGIIEKKVAELTSTPATVLPQTDFATAPTPVLGTPRVTLKAPATPR